MSKIKNVKNVTFVIFTNGPWFILAPIVVWKKIMNLYEFLKFVRTSIALFPQGCRENHGK